MIHVTIDPNAVLDREGLQAALSLNPTTIGREVRKGRLRAYRRAKRDYFLGSDVLEWLKGGAVGVGGHDEE